MRDFDLSKNLPLKWPYSKDYGRNTDYNPDSDDKEEDSE